MSDKENILLDPAEMDKIENMPEIKTVSEEDLPAESEVKEQFEEKPAPTASPDYTDAVPEASKPEHIGERSVCSIDALIQKILDGERQYDLSKIVSAYELAEKYHHNQKRESGEPYITHPLSVAYILLELGMDTDTICAALLHDVVEDTPCTLEELQKNFGSDVAMLVNGVTKLKKVETFTKDEQKAENIRKILLAMSEDIRVIIIKLADRLHNMRTLNYCKDSKRRTIAHETMNIYAPIAHRLGIRSIKDEFEDLAFYYLDPYAYAEIDEQMQLRKGSREQLVENIKHKIHDRLEKDFDPVPLIEGRVKSNYGIYKKVYRDGKEIDQIYDRYAVRIIVNTVTECYNVLGIIHDMFRPIPNRFKDYISTPKANMYQSLHTTVIGREGIPFEVQIRTWEMHRTAEYGIAAHWKYKEGVRGSSKDDQRLAWIRQIIESQQESNDVEEIVRAIKNDLAPEDVFAFTPKGDMITLPVGSTVIDFAYAIHTAVGSRCVGGKVNQRNETLRYVLKNGDQVSILTSNNQQPNADWLNIATTSKARNKIRQFLTEDSRAQATLGKEMLARRFKNWKLELTDEGIHRLQQHYKYKFAIDLYQAIAEEKLDMAEIKEFITRPKEEERTVATPREEVQVTPSRPISEDVLLIDRNVDNVVYKFARCCNPVFGDDILGFVSIGEGIKIHRTQCKNALDLQRRYPYRIVQAAWTNAGATSYQTVLSIVGREDAGMVTKITEVIAKDPKITLRGLSINSSEGLFDGQITVLVSDTEHLSQLISRLKRIQGVMRVYRHDSVKE